MKLTINYLITITIIFTSLKANIIKYEVKLQNLTIISEKTKRRRILPTIVNQDNGNGRILVVGETNQTGKKRILPNEVKNLNQSYEVIEKSSSIFDEDRFLDRSNLGTSMLNLENSMVLGLDKSKSVIDLATKPKVENILNYSQSLNGSLNFDQSLNGSLSNSLNKSNDLGRSQNVVNKEYTNSYIAMDNVDEILRKSLGSSTNIEKLRKKGKLEEELIKSMHKSLNGSKIIDISLSQNTQKYIGHSIRPDLDNEKSQSINKSLNGSLSLNGTISIADVNGANYSVSSKNNFSFIQAEAEDLQSNKLSSKELKSRIKAEKSTLSFDLSEQIYDYKDRTFRNPKVSNLESIPCEIEIPYPAKSVKKIIFYFNYESPWDKLYFELEGKEFVRTKKFTLNLINKGRHLDYIGNFFNMEDGGVLNINIDCLVPDHDEDFKPRVLLL